MNNDKLEYEKEWKADICIYCGSPLIKLRGKETGFKCSGCKSKISANYENSTAKKIQKD